MSEPNQETYADISAELRALSTSSKYCELQPKVEGRPISVYFAELADRIEEAIRRDRVCRCAIEIPVRIVPTCNVARAQRRLELLRAEMSDMADRTESGEKYRFNPRAVIAEIDDTLATRPRNCDVFADALWEKISRAWQDWILTPKFNKRKIGSLKEFCYWFLDPAKEGVAK